MTFKAHLFIQKHDRELRYSINKLNKEIIFADICEGISV